MFNATNKFTNQNVWINPEAVSYIEEDKGSEFTVITMMGSNGDNAVRIRVSESAEICKERWLTARRSMIG